MDWQGKRGKQMSITQEQLIKQPFGSTPLLISASTIHSIQDTSLKFIRTLPTTAYIIWGNGKCQKCGIVFLELLIDIFLLTHLLLGYMAKAK
jgi:hypothetical protein